MKRRSQGVSTEVLIIKMLIKKISSFVKCNEHLRKVSKLMILLNNLREIPLCISHRVGERS